jgi:hypothetical protein
MNSLSKRNLISKVMVPVVYGCDQHSAINAARAIAGEEKLLLSGFIHVPDEETLSMATIHARDLRRTLKQLYKVKRNGKWAQVHVSHKPWDDLLRVIEQEQPDLLVLEYPNHFEALQVSIEEVLSLTPCNIAIVNHRIKADIKNALIPIRGGPYTELALRIALSLTRTQQTKISSLHLFPQNMTKAQDVAFKGADRVLRNLPEIERSEIFTDFPIDTIFEASRDYDLVIMGTSVRQNEPPVIGTAAEKMMSGSEQGVLLVKTKLPNDVNPASEEAATVRHLRAGGQMVRGKHLPRRRVQGLEIPAFVEGAAGSDHQPCPARAQRRGNSWQGHHHNPERPDARCAHIG